MGDQLQIEVHGDEEIDSCMRYRNLSKHFIPKQLWTLIAEEIGLAGTLPQAIHNEYGLYDKCRVLRVIINVSSKRRVTEGEIMVGRYSIGRIFLFPCPRCTAGFLTKVFLHELCHAWLDQFHEDLYDRFESCEMADAFSDKAYKILGGKVRSKNSKCWEFKLDINNATAQLSRLKQFTKTYTGASQQQVQKWLGTPMTLDPATKLKLNRLYENGQLA